ncbi:hypothetical protein SAMN05444483_1019 [Salegentibacter echinorum]|uniref:DUF4145 domain-containing protein n=1 Tax=Salegentibacter echinorum TaxID=1073325 RepID=A0A1M5BFJ7_SALEC|nr:hypothetical protein [Salegentibacter echinorum]SHF41218.1 hypothetical protein SAMN05444483_1019 [Salegentibacter echinorum]
MKKEELIQQANKILAEVNSNYYGTKAQATEFLKNYAGTNNSFVPAIEKIPYSSNTSFMKMQLEGILRSFVEYVENGLLRNLSLEREIQIETVSDYLSQAETLLNDKNVHPVAPAVLIGASLEEFLRNWLEDEETDLSQIKLSLDSYTKELRKHNLISKQDVKDITSWGGTRNDAAHGHWENVSDRNRIKLMLEGVNLFMRKYSHSVS